MVSFFVILPYWTELLVQYYRNFQIPYSPRAKPVYFQKYSKYSRDGCSRSVFV